MWPKTSFWKKCFNSPVSGRQCITALIALYFFLVSISLLGTGFNLLGGDFANELIIATTNPFVALFIGIAVTSLVQTSSATTSVIVGMVASGLLPFSSAIPMIMGANIGTSVTNIIVSLCHAHNKKEFSLAFTGAVTHDFFNLCSTVVLLPLELITHIIENTAIYLSQLFSGIGGINFTSPLKIIISPTAKFIESFLIFNPFVLLFVSVVLLFICLALITKNLKSFIESNSGFTLDKSIFRKESHAFSIGLMLTAFIQSSSVATSLAVPLIATKTLSIKKAYPYFLGANLGTTITAFLAALAIATPLAISVSLAHFLFNLFGIIIFYPLKIIPITMAEFSGKLVSVSRKYALIFLIGIFYIIPLMIIFLIK
ncbi:MAG: Na/Pi symporter [Candidatus Diapherotrites archaeon]|nr:Na/Pi symporter [Candidatus Diapherotrites archaeon]